MYMYVFIYIYIYIYIYTHTYIYINIHQQSLISRPQRQSWYHPFEASLFYRAKLTVSCRRIPFILRMLAALWHSAWNAHVCRRTIPCSPRNTTYSQWITNLEQSPTPCKFTWLHGFLGAGQNLRTSPTQMPLDFVLDPTLIFPFSFCGSKVCGFR